MREELDKLALDVAEHVRYLRELGVTGLAADFPEPAVAAPEPGAGTEVPTPERFVPENPPVAPPPRPAVPNPRPSGRLDLLAKTKLSKLAPPDPPAAVRPPAPPDRPADASSQMNEAISEPEMPAAADRSESIDDIRADIGDCRRCELCSGRTQIVHSTGNRSASLMFVGEAPGADEDAKGEPFVGRAGQLLTKIIEAIGLRRDEVFIGNINRCRPPGNRAPLPDEAAACRGFLLREIAVVKPKVVVVLGNTAMKNLLDTKEGITKLRGIFRDYYGVKVMPTFHPAYLLRDPSKKREVWEDMKKVRDFLAKEE